MTNSKTTKRALFSSVVALLLCFTMLLGTTFAWFTDSASTAVNTIQAGTLDIVLEYSTDGTTWENAEGKTLNFKSADNRNTEILWEPGCTYELPAIRVRNNGNLALKYDIVINGVTGNAKLLEAIEFTANGNAISTFSGHLDTNGAVSESIVIKGHMKEEAGNEYQGLTLEGIGITVYATQYTYEKDSYDNMYDKVGAIGGGRIEKAGERWQISADFAATGVKTLAVNVVDTNGNIITTVTPETFVIPEDGVLGDPTDGSQYSWKTICAVVTGDSSSWQNTAFVPTMDSIPATMELVINGEVVDVSTITYGTDLWDDAVKAAVSGAIGDGRIENAGTRWQIAADFAATNVKTLAVNVKDANSNIITTVTPETFVIPEDGVLGDPTDGSQYSWKTICAVVTGDSSSWQNTAFVPTMDAVPTTMELVINGVVVATSNVTYGVNMWNDAVAAYNN